VPKIWVEWAVGAREHSDWPT